MTAGQTAMGTLFAEHALLPQGWARDVRIEIDPRGFISKTTPGASPQGAERLAGPLIPGMPNLHVHAFQRALAGLTARAGAGADSFWSWREVMYRFVAQLTPEDVEAVAVGQMADPCNGM